MTGIQAIEKLKRWGYQITLKKDGRISAVLPGGLNAPGEAIALLEDIRRDRESVFAFLKELESGAQVVQSEVQFFRSGDLCAFLALLWDVQNGKIQFSGDIVYHTDTDIVEAYWQPKEPLPFFQPSLTGKDFGSFVVDRLRELNREKTIDLPITQDPRKLIEEALLDSLLLTCE